MKGYRSIYIQDLVSMLSNEKSMVYMKKIIFLSLCALLYGYKNFVPFLEEGRWAEIFCEQDTIVNIQNQRFENGE